MQAARKAAMDAAAKALGMNTADLRQQLQSGTSLKDVAATKGVDFARVQSAISDAVKPQLDQAASTGQLTSNQATEALKRLTSGNALQKHHRHHGGAHPPAGGGAAGSSSTAQQELEAAAQALNMNAGQLVDQLKSGKSLEDLSTASGVDFSSVQSAINNVGNRSTYSAGGVSTSPVSGAVVNATA